MEWKQYVSEQVLYSWIICLTNNANNEIGMAGSLIMFALLRGNKLTYLLVALLAARWINKSISH